MNEQSACASTAAPTCPAGTAHPGWQPPAQPSRSPQPSTTAPGRPGSSLSLLPLPHLTSTQKTPPIHTENTSLAFKLELPGLGGLQPVCSGSALLLFHFQV